MTLLQERYTYSKLTRDESSGKRLYATPDGHKVPSVTTILDKTKPAESRIALANWRKAVGEAKAQQITTEAANRGTRMHTYLENYIKGDTLKDSVSNPYAQQSLVMAKKVIAEGMIHVDEVWGSEVPLYFPELYAGTTDCVGIHKGEESILDFKQTNKPKKLEYIDDYFIQLTAYAMAHNEVHGTNIRKGVILMCVKPEEISPGMWADPQYQEFILEPKDFDYWTERWCARVSEYYRLA
jgi:lambda repressor-like predicted transcriptional regulator